MQEVMPGQCNETTRFCTILLADGTRTKRGGIIQKLGSIFSAFL
jgi:hypothetical protein